MDEAVTLHPVDLAKRIRAGELCGLVFDKDGTLFDFHATWSAWSGQFIDEITAGDPHRADALAAALGYDLEARAFDRRSPMIAGTMEVVVEAVHRVLPEFDLAALRGMIRESTALAPQVEAVPLVPLFERLAGARLALGLATNDAELPARAHLQAAGLLGRFAFVAGYDSGHGAKPGPGMLAAFCRVTGLAPAACVMVGDTTHDLLSGRAAGMRTVAVLTGLASRDELAPLADAVLPDIGALPEWLGI
jgi:phosphoglycolate phosphatase